MRLNNNFYRRVLRKNLMLALSPVAVREIKASVGTESGYSGADQKPFRLVKPSKRSKLRFETAVI
jgi:hypothetical protein